MEMIQLEKENFKVDSTGWQQFTNKQGIIYLESPTKDIWEYVGGVAERLIGQQLFTWDAAMRETMKAGKRMPTDEGWSTLIQNPDEHGNGQLKKEAERFNLKALFAGYRFYPCSFNNLTSNAHFWSSSVSGSTAWRRYLYSTESRVGRHASFQTYGFSVRCLKD